MTNSFIAKYGLDILTISVPGVSLYDYKDDRTVMGHGRLVKKKIVWIFRLFFYSTVTDFARFFGLSISQFLRRATSYDINCSGNTVSNGCKILCTFGR